MTHYTRALSIAAMLVCPFAPARAQSTSPPAFEVASIRLHTGPLAVIMGLTISGTLVRMEGYSFAELVMEAYHVKFYQLSLPHALNTDDYYDLAMRAPGDRAPSQEEVRQMLQTLLADRFKLAIHREMRVMPVYALVPGKNGPKLKESTSSDKCSAHIGPPTPKARIYAYNLKGCSIESLTDNLTELVSDRPVVDKTGLTGKYDISLDATPNFMLSTRSDSDDISIFTAIKTLGLKLEAQRAPVEIIVVERIEKPTEN
jgi:uncharacterized protein (TIGR03435 family)